MGCCGNTNKNNYEIPYELIEEFNKLKKEIDEIITNNENRYRKDSIKLLELVNKTSFKISEYEKELDNLKNKKNIDKNIRDNYIKGINSDIKELKDYYLILDNLIKENDKDNENKFKNIKLNINEIQKENFVKKEAPFSNRDKTNNDILKNISINNQNNVNMNELNNLNLNNQDNLYFKKYVRRNKRRNKVFPKTDIFGFSKPGSFNFLTYNNGLINKEEISTSEVTNDIINIIFILENGKKVGIQINRNDKFLTAIDKLEKKEEELKDVENMILLDGEEDITDKVKNGERISSFGFNDYHFIQVKLQKKIN
jgi:hypothetical protein